MGVAIASQASMESPFAFFAKTIVALVDEILGSNFLRFIFD
jgi:hypothetical protein